MGEPHNELQRECYERYQYGLTLLEKMEGKSAVDLSEKYGVDRKTIMRIREGARPWKRLTVPLSDIDLDTIKELGEEYRSIRAEYLKHSAGAIANDLGIKKKTALTWGKGNFGVRPRKLKFRPPEPTRIDNNLALRFALMRLTSNPAAAVPTYY